MTGKWSDAKVSNEVQKTWGRTRSLGADHCRGGKVDPGHTVMPHARGALRRASLTYGAVVQAVVPSACMLWPVV